MSGPACVWCGVRRDVAPLVADMVVEPWICRLIHLAERQIGRGRLCPICAEREACVPDVIDGHPMAVCRECSEGEVVVHDEAPVRSRERVLRVLARSDGLYVDEVARALGEDDEAGRAKVSAALNRAVRAGLVQYSGDRMDRIYSLTPGAMDQWRRQRRNAVA